MIIQTRKELIHCHVIDWHLQAIKHITLGIDDHSYFVNITKNKENLQTIAKLIGRLANENGHASLLHLLLKALKSPFVRLSALKMMILLSALVRDREIFKIFNRPNLVSEVQMFTTAQFCQVSAQNTSLEIQF